MLMHLRKAVTVDGNSVPSAMGTGNSWRVADGQDESSADEEHGLELRPSRVFNVGRPSNVDSDISSSASRGAVKFAYQPTTR